MLYYNILSGHFPLFHCRYNDRKVENERKNYQRTRATPSIHNTTPYCINYKRPSRRFLTVSTSDSVSSGSFP